MFAKKMFAKKILPLLIMLLVWGVTACTPAGEEPPATLVAIANDTSVLTHAELPGVQTLQERPFGTGQIALYAWENEAGEECLVAVYLTTINGQWQTHDTASIACQNDPAFMSGYTGNSVIEAPFGPPRHTMVYGHSDLGAAVRIIWTDGMVHHAPLENGAFLEARNGKWVVERIELLDEDNNVLQMEDWQEETTA